MRILLVADGRSPITRGWAELLLAVGNEVHLASSFPAEALPGVASQAEFPVAFARWAGGQARPGAGAAGGGMRRFVGRFRGALLGLRYVIGPLTVRGYSGELIRFASRVQPDLIHALRIPFEGMLAAAGALNVPLVVSIWGNDLTLHANGSPWMAAATSRCLRRADGLVADARRDLRLAQEWGLRPEVPRLAVPGSGGVDVDVIRRAADAAALPLAGLAPDAPLVVNPRGFRPGSVRNDTFFRAAARVLQALPEAVFACPAMAGQPEALDWVRRLGIAERVRLLPTLPQPELWALFRRAAVMVSPSAHDGTPNSLLEAMTCGCLPVAGDIESLREWIRPGSNGLLVDAGDVEGLAAAILRGLGDAELRARAARENERIVRQRADRTRVAEQVGGFYAEVIRRFDQAR